MGTSSMYGGYSNGNSQGNPLLPDDFNEDSSDESNKPEKDDKKPEGEKNPDGVKDMNVSWQTAKTSMSKIASGGSNKLNRALSNYIKAHGGSKSASKSAISGVRTVIGIGQFINSVNTQGFNQTLEDFKIDFVNKSAKDILSELINYLAPTPVTKEDSIARKALIVTMEQLYEMLEKEGLEISSISNTTLNFLIPKYIENYVYERIINDLGSRIEVASLNSKQAIKIEQDIKDYINAKVDIAFKLKDFSSTNFSKTEVESLYNQCYTIMEDML